MTTLVRIAIAFIVAVFLSSCGFDINIGDFGTGKPGNGHVVKESRKVTADFTEVSASEGLAVYVSPGDLYKIEVEGDENIIDLIATDIKDGKLRIHAEENIGRATKNVYVSLPKITALKASSGSHLKTTAPIEGNALEIDGSSGALLHVDVTSQALEVDASSGANLTISGQADHVDVDVSSGGNVNAKGLQAKTCNADASSGGNVQIRVSESLTADATSGGNISYSGDPNVSTKKSVSGSVHQY
ncbi:head GIN domain-containing protein [Pseudozobellia thermophila]|uniref:Putative auto-transporter adhesin, head GIN domain n=1 Tax=Pseudozobellia thermophila TaxID=192903 RepID=A0A1M6FPS5_9FLAO|nr:head GIN domain-containing protein [Pseudozobellia thermophila]SHI99697.1 Putative auto-transporter adhesin, head GIN domain [Pseudozobellia thermophila]